MSDMIDFVAVNAPEHLDAVAGLEADSYPPDEAASRERIAFRMKEAKEFWIIALSGREVVGFVNGTLCNSDTLTHESMANHHPEGKLLCIHSVVTKQSLRRKGIGSRMLKEYVKRVGELETPQGGRRVNKVAIICKENLIGFYKDCGFLMVGPSPVVHGKEPWFEMYQTFASA